MKRKTVYPGVLTSLLVLFTITTFGQQLAPVQQRVARIDSFLTLMAHHQLFNGSILVAEKGEIVYKNSFGYADRNHSIKHTDTTSFNLASLSKPFTSLAILQLAHQEKLKLDDLVTSHLPDFPYQEMSVRHLLNQTSGLPGLESSEREYIKNHPQEIIANETVYAHLIASKPPLSYNPGTQWSYNNMNYLILALIVEKVSVTDFATYMQKNIFEAAGMKNTYIRTTGMPNTTRYNRPVMYESAFRNVDSLDHNRYQTYYHLGGITGSNNVVSTIQDLWSFDKALSAGKLIRPELMDMAFTPLTLADGKTFRMGSSTRSYGLGWNIYNSKTEPVQKFVFHDGHIVGLSTAMHKNLTSGQTIILYDNMDNNPIQLMISVSNIMLGIAPLKIRQTGSIARIYGEALVSKGIDFGAAKFNELRSDTLNYHVDESELNRLGYDFMNQPSDKFLPLSLEVFKLNTILYPKSGNTYDSYANAFEKAGKKEEAILMYRKSIALSPRNEDGKKALMKLLEQKE
ncbi:beta-lactamase family protein [Dyadobacter sp. CY261]|uniref:serine hydrolase domain-containing protein n=1 Tax=Dyadobacter sp. CY261 TaxID=2907203 RepID=UPI001F3D10D0|nr:serine hydrolase domain-containing protein [Dyadobacter sp. CY261]MCF0074971.1 beta-lactamase family protein [Dyadobacter sp. CY261]